MPSTLPPVSFATAERPFRIWPHSSTTFQRREPFQRSGPLEKRWISRVPSRFPFHVPSMTRPLSAPRSTATRFLVAMARECGGAVRIWQAHTPAEARVENTTNRLLEPALGQGKELVAYQYTECETQEPHPQLESIQPLG